MKLLKNLFGDPGSKLLKKYQNRVGDINAFEPAISELSDEHLSQKTAYFKDKLQSGSTLDDILPEAYAVVREASKRVSGERHYDVQLIGGMVIHAGNIAEMRTGEGKTLVGTLPVYLNALSGEGVHVVTVNDYLARRDAVWMGQIYSKLGLSIGVINQGASYIYDPDHQDKDEERDEEGSYKVVHEFLRPCTRRESYEADVTYGTNSEFGFDYLRDNIEYDKNNLRQRGHAFAVVDEIDSILIDEARTPLIISAPAQESENLYETFANIARQLEKETDFTVDEKTRTISLTDSGIEKAERALGVENIYTEKGIKYVHHLETAVKARALYTNNKEYVVREQQIVIVDEFTGRLQPGRRWSEGLHQAIEAKEGLPVQRESRTFASITYQNYFRMYKKLAGMTGTAKTNEEEFFKVYDLEVVTIPTHRDIARIDNQDLIYQTQKGKFAAIARRVKEVHETGQPILIGTASIEMNELLSQYLQSEGVPHEVLNAKNHESEGQIIANAGRKGAVTVATNMAGRGVDIKLGGVPFSQEAYEEVKALGGLFVLGTERHEARRIDNQLRGRSGRQGDPGETQFYVSLDDTLMRVFGGDRVKTMMGRFGIPEDQPIQNKIISRSLESAQTKIEGFHFDSRKLVLDYDNVLNTQRESFYVRRRAFLSGDRSAIDARLNEIATLPNAETIIKEKRELLSEDEFYTSVARLFLQTMDTHWVEHLETMQYLRSSVSLRGYGGRDPLIEYQKEGRILFDSMLHGVDEHVVMLLSQIGEGAFKKEEERMKKVVRDAKMVSGSQSTDNASSNQPASAEKKIGRNDMVTITKDGEMKTMKFKKAEALIQNDGWELTKV